MKTILVQHTPEKFMQNCAFTSVPEVTIANIVIDNNLYHSFFRYQPNHIIFSAKYMSDEVVQFCHDYSDQINIFVYHSLKDTATLKEILPATVRHIGHQSGYNLQVDPLIINDQLLAYMPTKISNGIICFLNNLSTLPQELETLLYPNTTIPIKIFDCPQIKHYQNLGITDEKDKAALIKTHRYYLQLDGCPDYTFDAIVCGTIPITIEELTNSTYKSKTPENNNVTHDTYDKFIQRLLAS